MPEEFPIVPPVVVAEGLDLSFYRSTDDVVCEIEPWFPSEAEYRAFDSQGRRLGLFADPPVTPKHLIGPIWTDNAQHSSLLVRATEGQPSGGEELAALLRAWLATVGTPLAVPDDLSLDELLAKGIERAGFS
jgi:hypothetical protein